MARSEVGYPWEGRPLLPSALRPYFGDIQLPETLATRVGLRNVSRLADLDERVWGALPRELIDQLADHLALAVGANRRRLSRATELIFDGPVPVEFLRLSTRAQNALLRHGASDGRIVYPMALERLARMRGVGGQVLLQVLSAAEALREMPVDELSRRASAADSPNAGPWASPGVRDLPAARVSRAVRREAAKLAKRRWAKRVSRWDPRLGSDLRMLVPSARDAYAAAQVLPAVDYAPAQARRTAGAIRTLISRGDEMARLGVRQELEQILTAVTRTNQQRVALRRRFGWDGRSPATLEEAAREIGVTRERVRQIEVKARKQLEAAWTPALNRALRIIGDLRFSTAEEIQQKLREAGLVTAEFSLSSLLRAARLFGRDVPQITERGGVVARADLAQAVSVVESTARRLTNRWGTTTVAELASVLAESGTAVDEDIVRRAIAAIPRVRYLDDERNWFWIAGSTRNRLLNQVRKILSVAGSIDLGELRDGVGRHHRMRGFRPPRSVLARLCTDTGLYKVEDDRVHGTDELPDWRDVLGENERTLAETLFEHGPVMRRADLEELVVRDGGMSRNSFYVYLTYSPILQRYGPSVFGLRGARVSAAEVSALIPPVVRGKVLEDHGWTADRHPWILYELSPSAVTSGVLSVPAALAPVLQGKFNLLTEDKAQMGTAVIDETRLWGVSPFYRRRGVEAGDSVAIVFNLEARIARVGIGDETLALRGQGSE